MAQQKFTLVYNIVDDRFNIFICIFHEKQNTLEFIHPADSFNLHLLNSFFLFISSLFICFSCLLQLDKLLAWKCLHTYEQLTYTNHQI